MLGQKRTNTPSLKRYKDKSTDDVYYQVSLIERTLESAFGEESRYTLDDVLMRADEIVHNFDILRDYLGVTSNIEEPAYKEGMEPKDTIDQAYRILDKLILLKKRAGSPLTDLPERPTGKVKHEDVYHIVEIITAEYISLASEIRLPEYKTIEARKKGKGYSDVLKALMYAERQLDSILDQYK